MILVRAIPLRMLGIARYAPGSAPLASWVGSMRACLTRYVRRSLAGTCVVFLRHLLERAPQETCLSANQRSLIKAVWGSGKFQSFGRSVGKRSSPLSESTVRWRDNEFSGVASWEVRSQKAYFGPQRVMLQSQDRHGWYARTSCAIWPMLST